MMLLKMIKADYKAYRMNPLRLLFGLFTLNTFYLVLLYRISHWLYVRKIPAVPHLIKAWGQFFYGAEIYPVADIGPGFKIAHSNGIVIGGTIGSDFECFQGVTIGGCGRVNAEGRELPILGDHVKAYAGCAVLGPVTIGSHVHIGVNCTVLKDIPGYSTVAAGNPFVLKFEDQQV